MKKLIFGLLMLGLTTQGFAQIEEPEELAEVKIVATNYKYLSQAGTEEVALPVKMLEKHVADFDLKNSAFYRDDYDLYSISFFIPEGKILAAYDRDGKVLRTVERYKEVALPKKVTNSVLKRFPGWSIAEDVYLVNYHEKKGVEKKYKLRLQNGDKRIWVKIDEKGNYM